MVLCPLTGLDILATFVFFVVHVFKRAHSATRTDTLWIALLVTAPMIFAPVYWYLHIWKGTSDNSR